MPRSRRDVLATACLLIGLEGALAAQEEPRRPQNRRGVNPARLLDQLDDNDDGFLDREEAPQRMKQRFARMDVNGDGKLSREELQNAAGRAGNGPARGGQAPAGDPLLRLLDADADGELSQEEIASAPRVLQAIDQSGDGKVDPAELAAIAGSRRGRRPGEIITPAAKAERRADRLKRGDAAPDFTLPLISGKGEVTLSSFQGKRPVVLIFASYT